MPVQACPTGVFKHLQSSLAPHPDAIPVEMERDMCDFPQSHMYIRLFILIFLQCTPREKVLCILYLSKDALSEGVLIFQTLDIYGEKAS